VENTLFESQRRYCDLVDKSRELDCVHDLSGILISINPMVAKSLGYEPEDLIGKDMSGFLHPSYRPLWADYLKRIETAKSDTGFLRAITRTGEERIWVYRNSLFEEAGKLPLVAGYAQDITEFKKVESLSKRFVSIIEATSDFVGTITLDGRILYGNTAIRKAIGPQFDEEISAGQIKNLFPAWAAEVVLQEGLPAAIKNGIWRGETALLAQDGREIPVSQVIIAHKSREGAVEFLSTIARDITEQKIAQSRLFAKDATTRVLAQSATIGDAIPNILETICQTLAWEIGVFWKLNRETNVLSCNSIWHGSSLDIAEFKSATRDMDFAAGVGLPGRVYASGKPLWIEDVTTADFFLRRKVAQREGIRSAFGFPILLGQTTLGVIEFFSDTIRQPDDELLDMMVGLGSQIGQFIERKKAEADVYASEARNRAILESAFDCIITIDSEGKIAEFNPAAEKTFGYKREKVVGENMFDLLVPASIREGQRRGLTHYLRTGNNRILGKRVEIMAMHAEGSEFPVELAITQIKSDDGSLMFTGFLRDITERKRAEKALQHNNHLLKALSRAQAEFITEPERKVLFGDLLEDLLSLTQSEYGFIGEVCHTLAGKPFLKTHAISNVTWDQKTRELYDKYSAVGAELHNLKPLIDETLATGLAVISQVVQSEGPASERPQERLALCLPMYSGTEMVGMIGIANRPDGYDDSLIEFLHPLTSTCSNIIQAYQTEQRRKLAEQEVAKLSLVASKTDNAVVITNNRDVVEWVNDGFVRLTGYTLNEVQGKRLGDILQGPHTEQEVVERIAGLLKSKVNFTEEILNYRKDGRPYWVSINISPILNDKGEVTRYIGIQTDITERKFKQEELRAAKEAAEAASVAKSQFLAVMSHEIRTPLNAIIGMTDLALQTKLAPDQFAFFKTVQSNSESLLYLINDILDFSKIEAGQMDIDDVPFKLGECVEGVAESLTLRAGAKRLELICDISENLPVCVSGDPNRFRQVLMNLVGNAIKFTEVGEVVIKLEAITSSDGKTVEIQGSVSDTGIGIADDKHAKIFDKFYQADDSTTRLYGGLGIGLSISKLLVELMQGEIWLASELGKGSAFHFRIPFKLVEPARHRSPRKEFSGLPVLLVDDNATSLFHLGKRLRNLGLVVDFAISANQALDMLHRQKEGYSMIFLDKFMPDMDGLELARVIRQEAKYGATKLLLMSLPGLEDSEVMKELDISEQLTKPIFQNRLLDGLEKVLQLPRGTEKASVADEPVVERAEGANNNKLRILVVEDNKDNQNLAKRILVGAGFAVEIAENGEIAVERAGDYLYDLILMDIQMPLMDGLVAAQEIRNLEAQRGDRRVPIIALTAHAIEGYRDKCIESGMDDYLTKPIKKDRLLETVNKWIDKRPAVLIVDDSAPSQLLIKAYLKGTDYQLFFASNGQEALDFFNRHWVSLVLLDMEMPILDGYATAKAIRQLPIGANLPIIAMTGHEGVEETNKCLNSGCSDYLGKPLRKSNILEAIRKNLTVKNQAEGSENKSANLAQSTSSQENQAQEIVVYVEEDIEDLVPEFLEGRHEDVKVIRESIQEVDFVNVQRLGHDMKGCGQGYGFEEISLIGKHLEAAAKEKNAAEILHWNDRLEKYLAVIKVITKREGVG
jgi:two-component system, sensor histidine kinase and response regulator